MIALSRSRVIAQPCQRAPQERAMIGNDDFLRRAVAIEHLAHNVIDARIILPLGVDEHEEAMIIEATPDAVKFLPLFWPDLPPCTRLLDDLGGAFRVFVSVPITRSNCRFIPLNIFNIALDIPRRRDSLSVQGNMLVRRGRIFRVAQADTLAKPPRQFKMLVRARGVGPSLATINKVDLRK